MGSKVERFIELAALRQQSPDSLASHGGRHLVERMSSTTFAESLAVTGATSGRVLLETPRGSIAAIEQIEVSVILHATLTESEKIGAWITERVPLTNSLADVLPETVRDLKPLWMDSMGTKFEAGGTDTANVVVDLPKMNVVLKPPLGGGAKWQIRNDHSGDPQGWSIEFWELQASVGSNITLMVIVEWLLIWIDTSRSLKATWDMDEITEEETQ